MQNPSVDSRSTPLLSSPLGSGKPVPGWKVNLAAFGMLIVLVMGYFFWQVEQAEDAFRASIKEQSRLLAGMISFSLKNSLSSQKAVEDTVQVFLESSAKFIDYLETIEPFSAAELASYAEEAGLAGVSILRENGLDTSGPPSWQPQALCLPQTSSLLHDSAKNLFLLIMPLSLEAGCVVVGFDATSSQALIEEIGLERFLEGMRRLPLINYVRLEEPQAGARHPQEVEVVLRMDQNNNTAESRQPFEDKILVIGIDSNRLAQHVARLWQEFILFSCLLAAVGISISWLLHRHQAAVLHRERELERQLAKQHEDAVLGRSAATISHEIKNPLNAISMGLQRIGMEMELSGEYKKLLQSMLHAVTRTNRIVSDLKQFTQPVAPLFQEISFREIIDHVLVLYREECLERNISIKFAAASAGRVQGDSGLLAQVVENVLKNSIEAQPDGGEIRISLERLKGEEIFVIENNGFELAAAVAEKIMEPYYTSKAKGTGLGMAIARKIVEAHQGGIRLKVVGKDTLQVMISLPCGRSESLPVPEVTN